MSLNSFPEPLNAKDAYKQQRSAGRAIVHKGRDNNQNMGRFLDKNRNEERATETKPFEEPLSE